MLFDEKNRVLICARKKLIYTRFFSSNRNVQPNLKRNENNFCCPPNPHCLLCNKVLLFTSIAFRTIETFTINSVTLKKNGNGNPQCALCNKVLFFTIAFWTLGTFTVAFLCASREEFTSQKVSLETAKKPISTAA